MVGKSTNMMFANPGVPTIVMIVGAEQRHGRARGNIGESRLTPALLEMIRRLLAEPATTSETIWSV